MKNWFYQLSKIKQIVFTVFLAHACMLLYLCAEHWIHSMPTKRRKVLVNTVKIVAPPVPPKVAATTPKAAPTKPVEAKKKMPPKPTPAKQPAATKPSRPNSSAQVALLEEIEASLEKVATPTPAIVPKTAVVIPTLMEVARESGEVGSSEEVIASFLQQMLTLPEFGEVRASVSIDKFGHLTALEVLSSKSEKNAQFLKNQLPELQFPCLNESTSLTIVFSNAL